jgi:hypothetical protein
MSHGIIAGFDSALRLAWYSDAKYPLSDALYASSRMKQQCNALIHNENGSINRRRLLCLNKSNIVRN